MQDHEQEFKTEQGDRIYVRVTLTYKNEFKISRVGVKAKGKRKVTYVSFDEKYAYRQLEHGGREREEYALNEWLKVATAEMLNEALTAAWMAIKPKGVNENE